MKRIDIQQYPPALRDYAAQVNIQRARHDEVFEALKALPRNDPRLEAMMDCHISAVKMLCAAIDAFSIAWDAWDAAFDAEDDDCDDDE